MTQNAPLSRENVTVRLSEPHDGVRGRRRTLSQQRTGVGVDALLLRSGPFPVVEENANTFEKRKAGAWILSHLLCYGPSELEELCRLVALSRAKTQAAGPMLLLGSQGVLAQRSREVTLSWLTAMACSLDGMECSGRRRP